jgi:hypothetical protein
MASGHDQFLSSVLPLALENGLRLANVVDAFVGRQWQPPRGDFFEAVRLRESISMLSVAAIACYSFSFSIDASMRDKEAAT